MPENRLFFPPNINDYGMYPPATNLANLWSKVLISLPPTSRGWSPTCLQFRRKLAITACTHLYSKTSTHP